MLPTILGCSCQKHTKADMLTWFVTSTTDASFEPAAAASGASEGLSTKVRGTYCAVHFKVSKAGGSSISLLLECRAWLLNPLADPLGNVRTVSSTSTHPEPNLP